MTLRIGVNYYGHSPEIFFRNVEMHRDPVKVLFVTRDSSGRGGRTSQDKPVSVTRKPWQMPAAQRDDWRKDVEVKRTSAEPRFKAEHREHVERVKNDVKPAEQYNPPARGGAKAPSKENGHERERDKEIEKQKELDRNRERERHEEIEKKKELDRNREKERHEEIEKNKEQEREKEAKRRKDSEKQKDIEKNNEKERGPEKQDKDKDEDHDKHRDKDRDNDKNEDKQKDKDKKDKDDQGNQSTVRTAAEDRTF